MGAAPTYCLKNARQLALDPGLRKTECKLTANYHKLSPVANFYGFSDQKTDGEK